MIDFAIEPAAPPPGVGMAPLIIALVSFLRAAFVPSTTACGLLPLGIMPPPGRRGLRMAAPALPVAPPTFPAAWPIWPVPMRVD